MPTDTAAMYDLLGEAEKKIDVLALLTQVNKEMAAKDKQHKQRMETDPTYRKEFEAKKAAEKAEKERQQKEHEKAAKAEQEAAKKAYALLKKALAKVELPTSSGKKRTASPNEFMLMVPKPIQDHWQFKHAASRNYVFVHARTGKMTVPQSSKAFMRGTFDESVTDRMRGLL